MAAPTIDNLPFIQSLSLTTLEDHLSRWCSSSSLSTSSSGSRSTSSTGYTDCPTMSKSFTDSMSSDTQTENETPPESPGEDGSHIQTTPIFREANHRPIVEYPCRPSLRAIPSYVSIYSEPGTDSDGADAGYETECEDKLPISHTKRSATRRKALDRSAFRRRGEPSLNRPISGTKNRLIPGKHIPSAPHLGTSTRLSSPDSDPFHRRGSLSRRVGPTRIAIPATSVPVFPSSDKASIGLGLGLGLPSTLSAVRRAPNCAYRSNTDSIPSPTRSLMPVTPADLLLPLDINPFPPIPMKPRLKPVSPCVSDGLSPLDLSSPLDLVDAISPPGAPVQPRHASFCFSHGAGRPADFCTSARSMTAAAFLTMANHAQTQRFRVRKGPPSCGSRLESTREEVCPGDEARGIRRYEAVNPYFATVGYCVTSG